jgi:hypothetical protein
MKEQKKFESFNEVVDFEISSEKAETGFYPRSEALSIEISLGPNPGLASIYNITIQNLV